MGNLPAWVSRAREQWQYWGQKRPNFAELPADGQESAWDYPRPPAVVPDAREVSVELDGITVAKTNRAYRVLETASPPTFYLPREDVNTALLQQSDGGSYCEWKGQATYWSIVVSGRPTLTAAAWSYEDPFEGFAPIAGYISFYPALLDCRVGRERVRPQPGQFYGGWITQEVVGPFKGDPRSRGW